jgi:hypothetical protein
MISNKYVENIKKTGFILENRIVTILRKEGWTVISNKYYEDDNESIIREMDILCYKVSKVEHLDVYTTLIVSCKKSFSEIWALISRDINLKNPNYDWWPLHAWSNDKAISYELSQFGMAKKYHEDNVKNGLQELLAIPAYEVFAFQEMNKESGAVKNDTNIFNSIKSLIKAQAYEIGVLPRRKTSPSVYQFNLISVIDSELFRINVNDKEDLSQSKIDSEQYLSRYILNKRESFSRIRFITADAFEPKLKDYRFLHLANTKWFKSRLEDFYSDVLEDASKREVYIEEFRKRLSWSFLYHIERSCGVKLSRSDIELDWDEREKCAAVCLMSLDITHENIVDINNNDKLIKVVRKALSDIYRYDGEFVFMNDLPFLL